MAIDFKALADLETRKQEIIKNILESIKNLPDNTTIQRVPGTSHAFIMNSSQLLDRSWSPSFYDFKHQYKLICDELATAVDVEKKLNTILSDGYIRMGRGRNTYSEHIHPDVINHINQIITT